MSGDSNGGNIYGALRLGKAPDVVDIPPCSNCGKDEGGKLVCSACKCVFYCNEECQKAHWKQGGHDKNCAEMNKFCEKTGQCAVKSINDKSLSPSERVKGVRMLAGTGEYKAACKHGLNEALLEMLREERDHIFDRLDESSLNTGTYTFWIMTALFRANRLEGKQNGRAFSHIDAYRCKKLIRAHPRAFEDWFEASMVNITAFVDPRFDRDLAKRTRLMRVARDVAAAWSLNFTNPSLAKRIILGDSRAADEKARQRATWIIKQLKPTLTKLWKAAGDVDHGGAVEAQVNQFTAMVFWRLVEYGVFKASEKNKFLKKLGIVGSHKTMFNSIAIPIADHMLRKGRAITGAESRAIMEGKRIEYD